MKKFFLKLLISSAAVLNLGDPLLAYGDRPEDPQGRISCRPSGSTGVSQISNDRVDSPGTSASHYAATVQEEDHAEQNVLSLPGTLGWDSFCSFLVELKRILVGYLSVKDRGISCRPSGSQGTSSPQEAFVSQEEEQDGIFRLSLPGEPGWNLLSSLPDDLKLTLVDRLSWKDIVRLFIAEKSFDHPVIWKAVLRRFCTDHIDTQEASRENVIRYALRVRVNAELEPEKIKTLMRKHQQYDLY